MVENDRGIIAIQEQHDIVRKKEVDLHPNSILILAPIVNERFGSMLNDDTPIEEIVNISRDSDMGSPIIKLAPIWDDINPQDLQAQRIAKIFAGLTLFTTTGLTIGEIRTLAKTGKIRKMIGLSKISEVFLADSFKKREII